MPGLAPPSQARRPRSKEIEKPADHNPKPVEASRRPPSSRPPSEKKKGGNARVGSNIKDNKETVPLGKRTNFGYERDFKSKYTLGKLLGHGQFGYTYVAIEKATGEKVAVKTIEKKQVSMISNNLNFA
jgi:calcium-dependent protein kinase